MNKPCALLLALFACQTAAADELGRLFFTPEQRAELDQEHAQHADSSTDYGYGTVLTVNGVVQRDGGARTVWINGVPQAAGKSDPKNPASVPVAVPGQSEPVKVKVGQKLLLDEPAAASGAGKR